MAATFIRNAPAPVAPPPKDAPSLLPLARDLFGSPVSIVLTLLAAALIVWIVPDLLRYFIFDAVWHGDSAACRAADGACWAFIGEKLPYFIYGAYPLDQRWRVNLVFALGAGLASWLLGPRAPARRLGIWLGFVAYPIAAFVFLYGAPLLGLRQVSSDLWGGMLVTLVVATFGIIVSLPFGILLALGRRSRLPAIRIASTAFIEFMRGVPMLAVLFMADTMLPLFLPEGVEPDRLVRPLVGVALFASAYMAEVVRGGLQALPKGQGEAGRSARPAFLVDPAACRPATGPAADVAGDRQHVHRPLQGYDTRRHGRHFRFSANRGFGAARSQLVRSDDHYHRLYIRGARLFHLLLRHVALCAKSRAAVWRYDGAATA